MNDCRAAFLAAAEAAANLVAAEEVAAHWSEPSAAWGMTVGGVAVHLVSGGIEIVCRSLDEEEPPGSRALPPSRLFSGQTLDLGHEGHRRIREMAEQGSRRGAARLAADAATAVAEVAARLDVEPPGRRVLVLGSLHMALDDFLITRLVELAAHSDDLAASVGLPTPKLPPTAVDLVVTCLTGVARLRHGDLAVVRTLARGERSPGGVFPVF